jgi:hypothetical protein
VPKAVPHAREIGQSGLGHRSQLEIPGRLRQEPDGL